MAGDIAITTDTPTNSGAFSDIYKAAFGGRYVAVKVFRAILPEEEIKRLGKQLEREIAIAQSLHHRNLLPVLGEFKGEWNGRPTLSWIIRPWMEQGNILDYLARNGSVSRTSLVVQIADALNYLHSQNVVHGNFYPSNVLIDDFGSPMISDFAIRTIHDTPEASTIAPIGQLRYMAPEIILSESVVTASKEMDVYAFACVVIEILTGQEPFCAIQTDIGIILALHDGKFPYTTFPDQNNFSEGLRDCLNYAAQKRPTMDIVNERSTLSYHCDQGKSRTQARL